MYEILENKNNNYRLIKKKTIKDDISAAEISNKEKSEEKKLFDSEFSQNNFDDKNENINLSEQNLS